jgi:hypothetical protein
MDSLLRLLLRFILVPLGYLAAVIVGACVILFGSWRFAELLVANNSEMFAYGVFGFAIAGPVLFFMVFTAMLLPASIGIVISEAFAIRSWIFHALNGAISAWVGWQMFANFDQSGALNETQFVFGAGLAGGFAYWAVAGWTAGFWKPVFARRAIPMTADNPFNRPAQTRV